MTVYHLNTTLERKGSSVDHSQAYRAKLLRQLGIPAKFIFTPWFVRGNLVENAQSYGFEADELLWLYNYFTDVSLAKSSTQVADILPQIPYDLSLREETVEFVRYHEPEAQVLVTFFKALDERFINAVEYVYQGKLVLKEHYTYTQTITEYFQTVDEVPVSRLRHFLNEDGSVAYEEHRTEDGSVFHVRGDVIYGVNEFIAYMLADLELSLEDLFVLDRSKRLGPIVTETVRRTGGRVAAMLHAEHYVAQYTDAHHILWHEQYEYPLNQPDMYDFLIVQSAAQESLIKAQQMYYLGHSSKILRGRAGSLDQLRRPETGRKSYSLMTVSPLAPEKHVDWVIRAVAQAKETVPELTLDIYGSGAEELRLKALVEELGAEDFVHFQGQVDATELYQTYEAFVSGTTSECFPLAFMEALGSGLPIIGLDMPYGADLFIKPEQSGFAVPLAPDEADTIAHLAQAIVQLFTQEDLADVRERAYRAGEDFLTEVSQEEWRQIAEEGL